MKDTDCFFERVAHFGVGMALLFIGMGVSVLSGTVFAALGFFIPAPVFFLSAFYFVAAESPECSIG